MADGERLITVKAPQRVPTGNLQADRALDGVGLSIGSLLAALDWVVVPDVVLPDATIVRVRHGLGRAPRRRPWVTPPDYATGITSGRIEIVDMTETEIQIRAAGWTVSITVDLLVT